MVLFFYPLGNTTSNKVTSMVLNTSLILSKVLVLSQESVFVFLPSKDWMMNLSFLFSLSYLTYSSPVHLKIIVTCSLVKCYRYSLYGYCYQKDLSLVKNSTRILQNALHFRRVIQLQYLTYVKELHMFKLQLNTFFYKHYFTKITFFLWSSGQPGGVQSLSSILHMRMKAQRGCVKTQGSWV